MSTETEHSAGASFNNQIDLEKLHLNSQWSDVKFLFDSGNGIEAESIPANKAVLAAQSDVFATMFYGEMKEKGDIKVRDASIGGFKEFLQFFHLTRVRLTIENVADVMNLGHKYNVTKCVDACAEFLKGALTVDNVCISLSLAILYEQQELMKYCEKYIASNSEAVLKSRSFLKCDKPVLAHILKMYSLFCSETVVFEACMAWIKAKSEQKEVTKPLIQEHLGELFYDFRFTSMKMEEFDALHTAYDYAFSTDEHKDILHAFASTKLKSHLFHGNPRCTGTATIRCDRKNASRKSDWPYIKYNKPTKFKSNQPLLLATLVFAPINSYRYSEYILDFPIDVTVIESSKLNESTNELTRTVLNFEIGLPLHEKETSVALPVPVRIQRGLYYEIRLNLECSHVSYECGNLMNEVKMENGLIIKFHGDRIADSNEFVNLITGLGFNKM